MKKLFTLPLLTALLCCMGAFLIASCSDDDKKWPSEVSQPFVSVTAADGDSTISAVISDADKTITFGEFQNMTDLSKVKVTFDMTWGAILKTLGTATAEVNLTSPYSVVVNVGYLHEETYLMSAKPKDIPNPILSAKVGDEEAVIAGNTITIAYKTGMNVNAMVFDIELVPGASLKSPADRTFDLEFADGTLVVTYGGTDYTYVVKQTGYTDPLLSQGWTDETGSFGTLPKYIKVYKTTKLNGVDNNIAYIAIMGPQSTMGVVGNGSDLKTIQELESLDGSWNVYLVGVSSAGTAVQTIIRDGQFVQDPHAINSFATIGQDNNGAYKMAWSQKFDGKLYAFPFRDGSSFTARIQSDGTVWDAKTAVSGIPMVLWNGNVLTEAQTICNDGSNSGWYANNPAYARAAVGVTAQGKVFAFCGQQVEGSVGVSMLDLAKVMKELGCVSAMSFEGSSSPNMRVNKHETVLNSKAASGSAEKGMQCALVFK